MDENKDIREELHELSPFLAKLKEESDGFEVPHNYFKGLPDEIMQKIQAETTPSTSSVVSTSTFLQQLQAAIQWLFQPQYALALASVAILLAAGWWYTKGGTMDQQENIFASLSEEEILNYIDNNIDNFDAELVSAVELTDESEDLLEAIPLEEEDAEEYLDEILNELDDAELEELL